MKTKIGFLSMLIATLLLAACSGGGGSTPDPTTSLTTPKEQEPEVTASTGVLLDSPVAGIQYRTATKDGVTNANGEYEYVAGETVIFFIGDLEFPPVKASGVVTPVDIAKGDETLQTNILRILQTLDSDGDPDNGITIYKEATAAFADVDLDLYSDTFDAEVASVLETIDEDLALVSEAFATAHFEKSLKSQILGSWVYSEGDGMCTVLTFIDKERYIMIHEFDELAEGQNAGSVEYGTYTWDTTTDAFEVKVTHDGDGYGGLWDEGSKWTTAAIRDSTLVLHLTDEDDNEDFDVTFTQVTNPVDSIKGAYIGTSEDDPDDVHVLTFLSDSKYVIAHTQNTESYSGDSAQALSGEFGTYTLDGNAFKALSVHVDTDGEGGLYNYEDSSDQENTTLRITEKGNLAFVDDDEGTYYLLRISNTVATTPVIPEAFIKEWLQGQVLYNVWFGEGENPDGIELYDVAVVEKYIFNADGKVSNVGLMNSNGDETSGYTASPSGLLFVDDPNDDETPDEGNTIVCGSTADYIKTHYTEAGNFDNVDLFFFDEAKAMIYAEALAESIPACLTAMDEGAMDEAEAATLLLTELKNLVEAPTITTQEIGGLLHENFLHSDCTKAGFIEWCQSTDEEDPIDLSDFVSSLAEATVVQVIESAGFTAVIMDYGDNSYMELRDYGTGLQLYGDQQLWSADIQTEAFADGSGTHITSVWGLGADGDVFEPGDFIRVRGKGFPAAGYKMIQHEFNNPEDDETPHRFTSVCFVDGLQVPDLTDSIIDEIGEKETYLFTRYNSSDLPQEAYEVMLRLRPYKSTESSNFPKITSPGKTTLSEIQADQNLTVDWDLSAGTQSNEITLFIDYTNGTTDRLDIELEGDAESVTFQNIQINSDLTVSTYGLYIYAEDSYGRTVASGIGAEVAVVD